MDKLVTTHRFSLNPFDNSGEQIYLITKVYDNGDEKDNIYFNQELKLQSYCNSASFNLVGAVLTSKLLRQMADEMEQLENLKRNK